MKICPKCQNQADDDQKFCMYCGTKFVSEERTCSNCGKMINQGSRFCMFCGMQMSAVQQKTKSDECAPVVVEPKHQEIDDSAANIHPFKKSQKITGRNIKLFGGIAIAGIAAILVGIFSVGFLNSKPKEEEFEAFFQQFTDSDVLYEEGELFVDSEILLTAKRGTSKDVVQELVKKLDGEIVGYISISDDYQITFPAGKTRAELNAIVDSLSTNEDVDQVSLHNVFLMEPSSVDYSGDPWKSSSEMGSAEKVEWSEALPSGSNWWAEAIMLPAVWKSNYDFAPVKVGIVDSMFDTSHSDLKDQFVKVYQNPDNVAEQYHECLERIEQGSKNENVDKYVHGTHVAGIIAAQANTMGIAGVSQNAKLYGYAYMGENTSEYISPMKLQYIIATLLSDGVKVINYSMGNGELTASAHFDATAGLTAENSVALRQLETLSATLEKFLSKCLEIYDFLIVTSAGNECNDYWVENKNPTDKHPYSYIIGSSAGKRVANIRSAFKPLAAIDDPFVRSHIITVGAVDLYYSEGNPKIRECTFSNSDPDVYAPGGTCTTGDYFKKSYEILSDIPGGGLDDFVGTSQAAPVVSGIASLIWGVNPDLTATEVRTLITGSASNSVFPAMVNAADAVRGAVQLKAENNGSNSTSQQFTSRIVMGYAYYEEKAEAGAETVITPVKDAEFTVYDENGTEIITQFVAGPDGTFSIFLEPGKYMIRAVSATCGEKLQSMEVGKTSVCFVTIEMKEIVSHDTAYQKVLEEYQEACTLSVEEFSQVVKDGHYLDLNSNMVYEYLKSNHESIMFAYYDIDHDGTMELLLGSSYDNGIPVIIDLYSFDGKKAVKLIHELSLGYRAHLSIYTDGTLHLSGSGGADSSSDTFYCLKNGYDISIIKEYSYDGYLNPSETPYYSTHDYQSYIKGFTKVADIEWCELIPPKSSMETVADAYILILEAYRAAEDICRNDGWADDLYDRLRACGDIVVSIPTSVIPDEIFGAVDGIAYTLEDLNKDGTVELVIGTYCNDYFRAYDIFTQKDGSPIRLCSSDATSGGIDVYPNAIIEEYENFDPLTYNRFYSLDGSGNISFLGEVGFDMNAHYMLTGDGVRTQCSWEDRKKYCEQLRGDNEPMTFSWLPLLYYRENI